MSPKRFDVFISFRGEDTRTNFTSHLHTALSQNHIKTYIDYNIQKGDEVWSALAKAIKDSHISILVFSENYASSNWCLEELVKILECRKNERQVVIPVFYKIDPSHVRKQIIWMGDLRNDESIQHKMSKWKAALTEAANISGWDTSKYRDDSQVIQNIVNDVKQKLYLRYPSELKGLVGIDKSINKIQSSLANFQVIGIWGMGGIGKTTIAKALFARLFPQYDNVCFLANVREESQKLGLTYVRDKLLSELLKEENPKSNVVGSTFITGSLSGKKVFIVLDDVDSLEQLDYLRGESGDLGPESRLIITTRDRKLLHGRVNRIHRVEKWNNQESLKLFSLNAFKKSHPEKGFEKLSERAVEYAGGVPLALKLLGSYLHSESNNFWESELSKLKKYPKKEIQNVLEVSYNGLDQLQKDIFLDIAFFFKEENKDQVMRILNACGFFPDSGIDILVDKALITISHSNRIQMHDLLQEMGLEIVRQKCREDPGRRCRLRDIEDVCNVLRDNKGTGKVEGITLDLSQIGNLILRADTFHKMCKLRFLKFYIPFGKTSGYVYLPSNLKSFSNKLRYFEWNGYPLKSLPQGFCAKLLVEIRMPHSDVTELWQGKQYLANLEGIDLTECKQLMKLPDLSRASKLEWVYLSGCESLRDLHPSILSLDTLVSLILDRCKNLKSLKSEKHLSSLEKLSVNGCSSLKEFSVSSDSFERLDLSNTGIKMLHSSIRHLSKLVWLNLEGLRLQNLPNELSHLTSLKDLRISNCRLVINKQKLHVIFAGLQSLQILYLKDCCNLSELPNNISVLSSLHELRLDGSSVENLPAGIKHLHKLEILSLENCRKLQCLPELPPFIKEFYVINCTSLVTLTTLKSFAAQMIGKEKYISFRNCLKLDKRSLQCIIEGAQLTMMSAAFHNVLVRRHTVDTHSYIYNSVGVCLPGRSSVLGQFTYQTTCSSITIDLPSRDLLGFIFYVVVSPSRRMKKHGAKIQCQCHLRDGSKVGYATTWHYKAIEELNLDHVYVWYDPFHCDSILRNHERQIRFEFCVTNEMGEHDGLIMGIKECGIKLICVSEFHSVLRELELESVKKVDLGVKLELALELEQKKPIRMGFRLLDALEQGLELKPSLKLDVESRREAILKEIEKPDENESNGSDSSNTSEKCSCDCLDGLLRHLWRCW